MSFLGSAFSVVFKVIFVLIFLFALLLGYLKHDCCCRRQFFTSFMRSRDVTKHSRWTDEVTCPLIINGKMFDENINNKNNNNFAELSGVVVDVGSGAGASLICYQNLTKIKKLFLIEPISEFHADLEKQVKFFGLQDIAEIITTGGEEVEKYIKPGTVDYAVSVHLLCSVDSDILKPLIDHTSSLLKKGTGQWRLIDHTTHPDENSWVFWFQQQIAPIWLVIGNGCKFMTMPQVYSAHFNPQISEMEIKQSSAFEFPIMGEYFYPVKPHYEAVVQRIGSSSSVEKEKGEGDDAKAKKKKENKN